ncbi:hypothetical protein ACH5RR_009853 [Cinchona calisaya]|uniref:RNase H type-1 domain-containing protein n=1 Tax=Cinchona calisaya TaxID=153742 RepID=A0ABD3AHD2_9GENT
MQEWGEFSEVTREEKKGTESDGGNNQVQTRWKPPRNVAIVLNSDAATSISTNKSVLGVVARDRHGQVVAIWVEPLHQCLDAEIDEAMVLRLAMIKAKEEGWDEVGMLSD